MTPQVADNLNAADRLIGRIRQSTLLRNGVLQVRTVRSAMWDRWLGIKTMNPPEAPHRGEGEFGDGEYYESIDYPLLRILINRLQLRPDDVVYDIGCGMGRMLCMLGRHRTKQCVGIEVSASLAQVASENGRRLRGRRSPIEVRVADAASADYASGTVYCMFNPFGATTMSAVLKRIHHSLREKTRPIRIMYANPRQEVALKSCNWLKYNGIQRSRWHQIYASYWQSISC